MAKYDGATLDIVNWDKYNPKRDQSSYTWLRLNNDFAADPKLFGLSPGLKFGWVVLLCEASKRNNGKVFVSYSWFERMVGLKNREVTELIDYLVAHGITTASATAHDREMSPTISDTTPTYERTNVRTNETNETNETHALSADEQSGWPTLAKLWNENRGPLPGIRECGKERTKKAKARFDDKPDEAYWVEVIKRLSASPFCQGKGKTGWRADFDFLLQPETAAKAREGKYDDRSGSGQGAFQRTEDLDSEMKAIMGKEV